MGKRAPFAARSWAFFLLAAALAAAGSARAAKVQAYGGFKAFRSASLGVKFRYPAGYQLAAVSPLPPEAAAYEFHLLKLPPAVRTGRPPYIRHYKVSILKLALPAAAKAAGFAQQDGKWMIRDQEAAAFNPAQPISGHGWEGLCGSYTTRLYLPEGAPAPSRFWHEGRYLGLAEGKTIVVSGGGTVSVILNFDPDLGTKPLQDAILKSLRFFKPPPPLP